MGQRCVKFETAGETPLEAIGNLKELVQIYYPELKLKMCTGIPTYFKSDKNTRKWYVKDDNSSKSYVYSVYLPLKYNRLNGYCQAFGDTPEEAISNLCKLVETRHHDIIYNPEGQRFEKGNHIYKISNPTHVVLPISDQTLWSVWTDIPNKYISSSGSL